MLELLSRSRAGLAAILLIAGCASVAPQRPVFPELSYAHLAPLRFDAGKVTVVEEYVAPLKRPNVEHEMPLRPSAAAVRWANDRVKAAGGSARTVRVTVKKAGVVETELPRSTGLRRMFTTEQAQRYDAELELIVEVLSDRGLREGFASAQARRSTTVAEDITLAEREKVYFTLVEQMMADIDRELESNIRQYMAPHLR
jgi:hypothetical protein